MDPQNFRQLVIEFVKSRKTGTQGEYTMFPGGNVTLYASCFAAMILHYVNALYDIDKVKRNKWVDYINGWQDSVTGRFIGLEIVPEELTSPKHDWNHVTMHLTAHAIPALHVLGGRPLYPLHFAHRFLDQKNLRDWLDQRDWKDAWLEGNNLLFVGQFLVYLRDFEGKKKAQTALDTYFDWLDAEQDPSTGLWGTNGYCDSYEALYGAYHQLLVYHYCNRPVHYAQRIIDTVLNLQHPDGSFTRSGGGGACEDVDAVDVLVNLYKSIGYKPRALHNALQRVLKIILDSQMPDGGFVYRRGTSFSQLGIPRTFVPVNTPDMFSTWFRVHTIALICQVLQDHPLAQIPWRFNSICSMGWHDSKKLPKPRQYSLKEQLIFLWSFSTRHILRSVIWNIRRSLKNVYQNLLNRQYYNSGKDYEG
jgi:hypothetical protein